MKRDRASVLGDVGVLLDPSFRAIAALVALSAMVTSSAIPLLALFLTQDLGGTASDATALFIVLSIVGTALALSSGRLSDRTRSRTGLISFAFGCMATGYVLVAASRTPLAVIVLGGSFLGAYAVANSQLFALVRERSVGEGTADTGLRSSAFRALYSLGWVIGPVLGGFAYTHLGARASFCVAAVAAAVAVGVALAGDLRRPLLATAGPSQPLVDDAGFPKGAGRTALMPSVLVFGVALVLLASGGVMRSAVLPVHLAENLHLSGAEIGAVLAATPLAEIICLPIVGLLCGTRPKLTLYVGGLSAVTYFLGLAVADSLAVVVMLLQVLFAVYVAVVTVAGMLQLQQALPKRPGLATSGFFSTELLATLVGSVVAAVGVGLLGEHHGFLVPMAVAAVGCALLVAALRHLPRSSVKPA